MQVNASFVCPDGKYSPSGSDSIGDCICPDFSSSRLNSKYVSECICDPGYFKQYSSLYAIGGWFCVPCNPGQGCFNNSNYTCPDHASSYAMAKGYTDCWCLSGFLNATERTEANFCQVCPTNSYCTGKGAVQSCTANAVSPVQSASYTSCFCDLGWQGVNNSACVGCQSPTYCYGGLQAQCSEGTYSPSLAWDRLNCSCIAGRWGPTGGPCIVCSAGKYNTFPGCKACTNTSDLDCSLCEIGTASNVLGRNTTCDVCLAGKFSSPANQLGARTCETCSNGTVSGIGAGSCTACLDGWYAVSGASVCTRCAAGTYGGGVVSTCTSCPAGMYGIEGLESAVRAYPPKVFDSSTSEVSSTFLGRAAFNQNITLSSTGISYGAGQYSLYFSSVYGGAGYSKSNLFFPGDAAWGYNTYRNGTYIKSDYISSSYLGEWLVIKFPSPMRFSRYLFRMTDWTPAIVRSPGEWKIYGSVDGVTFSEILGSSVTTRITTDSYINRVISITINPASDWFLYLGFTFNKLAGQDSPGSSASLVLFDELVLYGTEFLTDWTLANRCASCPAGAYSSAMAANSSSTCASCSAGTFSSTVGASTTGACRACVAGTYSTGAGVTSCTSCQVGSYSTSPAANSSGTCILCAPGKYSTILGSAQTTCPSCMQGKYSTASGLSSSVACFNCISGTYSTTIGAPISATCLNCVQGTYSTVSGAPVSTNCSACQTGKYSTGVGINVSAACVACSVCSIGQYNLTTCNSSSNIVCGTCTKPITVNAGNYYFTSTGYGGPASCSGYCQNQYYRVGTQCIKCELNSWCRLDNIYACPPNTASPAGTAYQYICKCNSGYYGEGGWNTINYGSGQITPPANWNGVNCEACSAGKYSNATGVSLSSTCQTCNSGTYSTVAAAWNSSTCALCVAGSYSTMLGRNRTCDVCVVGKFSSPANQGGALTCETCANGTVSGIGAGNCTVCADGRYATGGASVCTMCPVGSYGGGMVSACLLCPAGMHGTLGADSNIRAYPPKDFDSKTDEVPTTFMGRPAYNQNITLNSTGISYGSGQYSLYFSSVASLTTFVQLKSNLFLSSGSATRWQPNAYEQVQLDEYTRNSIFSTTYVNETYISSDYMGEWIVLQFPYQIRLTQYVFKAVVMAYSHPAEFKMYGSTDGLSFSEIPQASVMNKLTQNSYRASTFTKTVTPPSNPLLYLGFTVNKLTTPLSTFNSLQLSKFVIYGTEFVDLWNLTDRCASCPTGTYSTALGPPSPLNCTRCDAGTYSTVIGAASVDNCSVCVAGTYSTGGADVCQSCSPGTFSTAIGGANANTCQECRAGTFSAQEGDVSCSLCLAGSFSLQSATTCESCPAGTYSTGIGSGNCSTCVAGTYSIEGVDGCQSCSPGTFSTAIGGANANTCQECQVGTFSTQEGGVSCSLCLAGSFSLQNATTCESCLAGAYTTGIGSGNCSLCDAGTYSLGGAPECTPCGVGLFNNMRGRWNCTSCLDGSFAGEGKTEVMICSGFTHFLSSSIIVCVLAVHALLRGDIRVGTARVERELSGMRDGEILDCAGRIELQRVRGVRFRQVLQRDEGGHGERTTRTTHVVYSEGCFMEPFSVFLGNPFLSVVLVDGPTVLGEIVWNLDDGQFAIEACCALQAYAVDNSQQDRVVSRDVFVGIPVGPLGDVGCQDLVRVLSLVGQVEPPEAAVHHDPAGHAGRCSSAPR
jgi:hypothetical protein